MINEDWKSKQMLKIPLKLKNDMINFKYSEKLLSDSRLIEYKDKIEDV